MREIKFVFQDCADCGDRAEWWTKQLEAAAKMDVEVVKLPFFADGARELILTAHKGGIEVPFFTDGEKFVKSIEELAEKPKAKRKKVAKE